MPGIIRLCVRGCDVFISNRVQVHVGSYSNAYHFHLMVCFVDARGSTMPDGTVDILGVTAVSVAVSVLIIFDDVLVTNSFMLAACIVHISIVPGYIGMVWLPISNLKPSVVNS